MINGLYLINWPWGPAGPRWGQIDSFIAVCRRLNQTADLFCTWSDPRGVPSMQHWGRHDVALQVIQRYARKPGVRVYICPTMFRHHIPIDGVRNQFFDGVRRLAHTPCPRSHHYLDVRIGEAAKLVAQHHLAGVVIDVEPYASGADDVLPVYSRPAGTYRCRCIDNGCHTLTARQQWRSHAQYAQSVLRHVPRFGQMSSTESWIANMGADKCPIAIYERTYEGVGGWLWNRKHREVRALANNGWATVPGIWNDRRKATNNDKTLKRCRSMRGSSGSMLYTQTGTQPGARIGVIPAGIDRRPFGSRDAGFFDRLARAMS